MNVLIIGGSYFNGRALVEGFLRDNHQVTVLNRGTHRMDDIEQLTADRDVPEQVQRVLNGRSFDWVADTSCYTSDQSRIAFTALRGRFGHWVQLSSAAVYIEDGTLPMDEDQTTGRSLEWGDYGLLKWQADEFLLEEWRDNRIPVTIIRPPYTYGPNNYLEREIFFWSRLLQGRPVLIPDSGQTPVQFLHVADLYEFVCLALAHPTQSAGQVFNLAHRKAITFKSLVELLASIAGVDVTLVPVAYRALGVKPRDFFPFRDYPCVLDVNKAESVLGWVPRHDLRSGLIQTLATWGVSWLATKDIDTNVEDRILDQIGNWLTER